MPKTHSTKLILFVGLLPLILCGCYDRFELDNLAYVIAVGADMGSGENLDITYQIAIPVTMTGEGAEPGANTYTTYTVSAPSLSVANTLVSTRVSKGINLSHVKLILYSEEIARDGLSGRVNVFISQANIRPKATIAVCEGKAKEFLESISPKLEASPSRYYELLFGTYNYTTQSEPTQLIDLYTAFQSIDQNAYATYVKISEESGDEKEAILAGIAIFKSTKMIEANEEEDFLLAHAILTNNLKQSGYTVPDFHEKNRVISVRLIQNEKPHITVNVSGDHPHIHCQINLEAHLVASGSNINFYDKQNENRLKEMLQNDLEEKINAFFKQTTEEYQSDIAMIGKCAKCNFTTWKEFQSYDWLGKYSRATYDVAVNTRLNISQIISHTVPNAEK